MFPVPFPCRPQQTQQLQLPGLADAHSSLLDVIASPLPTLDWCCTSKTMHISRVIVLGLILQEEMSLSHQVMGLNGMRTKSLLRLEAHSVVIGMGVSLAQSRELVLTLGRTLREGLACLLRGLAAATSSATSSKAPALL